VSGSEVWCWGRFYKEGELIVTKSVTIMLWTQTSNTLVVDHCFAIMFLLCIMIKMSL